MVEGVECLAWRAQLYGETLKNYYEEGIDLLHLIFLKQGEKWKKTPFGHIQGGSFL